MRRMRQRSFFGLPLAAGSCCELDTASLGPGVALAVSQVTLAGPLASASDEVRLLRNGAFICALSHSEPNARLPFNPAGKPSLECIGPEGSGVHVVGYTYVHAKKRRRDVDVGGPSEAEYTELQLARSRRVEELRREAVAEAARPCTTPTPLRTRRLSFNPEVVGATYTPQQCGISPEWVLPLDEMVARREEIKTRQALERPGDDADDGGDEDDGEALQHVLAVLLSSSDAKLRALCKANGLDRQGSSSALIERLIDHIAMDLRERRRQPTGS